MVTAFSKFQNTLSDELGDFFPAYYELLVYQIGSYMHCMERYKLWELSPECSIVLLFLHPLISPIQGYYNFIVIDTFRHTIVAHYHRAVYLTRAIHLGHVHGSNGYSGVALAIMVSFMHPENGEERRWSEKNTRSNKLMSIDSRQNVIGNYSKPRHQVHQGKPSSRFRLHPDVT